MKNLQKSKKKNQKPCPKCGGMMHRQSKVCAKCHLKKVKNPSSYIEKICPICQKSFTVHKGQLEAGYGKYCSRSCARRGSPTKPRKRERVTCDFCNRTFEKHISEIARAKTSGSYCSPECWYAHNQGENHYGYNGATPERQACSSSKEWKRAVKVVWKRDKASCQRCGIKAQYYEGKFHIHHIVSFKVKELRTDPKNLILFCSKCHIWVHSNENTNKDWVKYVNNEEE